MLLKIRRHNYLTLNKDTALLLFTRSAEEEAHYKAFSKTDRIKTNQAIACSLIEETKKTLSETDLPVFIIDSDKQIGNTFGERYANAFQQVFDSGYKRVISVGNDCPELTSGLIFSSSKELLNNDLVLGPTPQGGAYLIGLNKSAFQKKNFQELDWQTEHTLSDLIKYIHSTGSSYFTLKMLSDVNNFESLIQVLQSRNLQSRTRDKLRSILSSVSEYFILKKSIRYYSEYLQSSISLRAPPVV